MKELGVLQFVCLCVLITVVESSLVDLFVQAALHLLPNPDAHLSADEIIFKYGYPVQTHYVSTSDGYNLTVFRIPHGRHNVVATKGPVFLQHGLQCSSNDWVLNAPNNTLPYMLADEGYDVYIGNARGSNYSANNINRLNPKKVEYWNFSFHEMGYFDIPAVIDYILEVSGAKKLFYIGHSMGTTMFFVAMSEHPELNSKIKGMFAMAPVTYFGNAASPIVDILSPIGVGNWFYRTGTSLGQGQLLPTTIGTALLRRAPKFCRRKGRWLCNNVPLLLYGYDPVQVSNYQVSNIFGHSPSNTSVRSFAHFIQLYDTPGQFRQYNWGIFRNMMEYGSFIPPSYNLKKVTAPVYIYWGQADILAHPKDIALLRDNLPPQTVKEFKRIDYSNWNHQDFLYGKDAGTLVYKYIIAQMKDAENVL